MVTLLQEHEVDLEAEDLDVTMEAAQALPTPVDDLRASSRRAGGPGGNRVTKGRAVARRAWMWDGTETTLPIAWDPEGKRHDGARAYMSKKHCLCCGAGGFRGTVCVQCVRSNCQGCRVGTDKAKVIRNFYLKKEDVPYPKKFYGPIDCFLGSCIRKNGLGFKSMEDMLLHARSRHRMEYASHREAEEMRKSTEADDLRRRVDELTSLLLNQRQAPEPTKKERTPAQKEAATRLGATSKARWAARKAAM